MIDSHCHLADTAFSEDLDSVIARARAAGVTEALCILSAIDEEESARAREVLKLWQAVVFAVGVHPHTAGKLTEKSKNVEAFVRRAISETEISKIDWKKFNVNVVLECTGKFNTKEKSSQHISSGAKKVLVSAPCKGAINIVFGVNQKILKSFILLILTNFQKVGSTIHSQIN